LIRRISTTSLKRCGSGCLAARSSNCRTLPTRRPTRNRACDAGRAASARASHSASSLNVSSVTAVRAEPSSTKTGTNGKPTQTRIGAINSEAVKSSRKNSRFMKRTRIGILSRYEPTRFFKTSSSPNARATSVTVRTVVRSRSLQIELRRPSIVLRAHNKRDLRVLPPSRHRRRETHPSCQH
jgi:hypothetical protein